MRRSQLDVPVFQVTTHSHVLSPSDVEKVCTSIGIASTRIHSLNLHRFETEDEFVAALQYGPSFDSALGHPYL